MTLGTRRCPTCTFWVEDMCTVGNALPGDTVVLCRDFLGTQALAAPEGVYGSTLLVHDWERAGTFVGSPPLPTKPTRDCPAWRSIHGMC